MLGDYYKLNPKVSMLVDAAIEVVKWFNNHSYCLGMLNAEQLTMYKKVWALILPVISWWTSHFCSMSCLPQVNKVVRLTATQHQDEFLDYVGKDAKKVAKAERVLDCVVDENWWKELTMYVNYLLFAGSDIPNCATPESSSILSHSLLLSILPRKLIHDVTKSLCYLDSCTVST